MSCIYLSLHTILALKWAMLSLSCTGELRLFFLNLEWTCTFVHCPEMLVWSKSVYCIMYLPNRHQAFYGERGTDLGIKSSENPFPSAIQQTDGHLKHCLFLGSFSPAVLAILLLAPSHCCGLLLLWDVIAQVLAWCLAAWSSCCPAFLAKWSWVNWRRKTCSSDLILQRGRSPSRPLDYEYHLFILSSGGLSGQKPLFTPCKGRIGLWLVTIFCLDSSKSTGKVEARLQVLCPYGCATSSSVWTLKKAFRSLTLLQVQLTAQSLAMGGIGQPS